MSENEAVKKMFVITHPTFDRKTLVAIGVTDRKIKKWARKNTHVKADADFMEHIKCPGLGRTVVNVHFSMIRMSGWEGTNRNIAHLAHEAFHLAEMTFWLIGIKHDVETSSEAYAYFIQHTVEQILDELNGDALGVIDNDDEDINNG